MEEEEYIIINKTVIQKRIEELEKSKIGLSPNLDTSEYYNIEAKINLLKEILSQSTPLIPEIEKAIQFGLFSFEEFDANSNYDAQSRIEGLKEIQQDYISNLKLDI